MGFTFYYVDWRLDVSFFFIQDKALFSMVKWNKASET